MSDAIRLPGFKPPSGNDHRAIAASKHISGGIRLEVGSEDVLMSPRMAFDLATGILLALGLGTTKTGAHLPG